jgi:phosphatidylglycerophosphatase A
MAILFKSLLCNPVQLLAFGFGAGLAPKAPGTFGTLVAIPLYLALYALHLSVIAYIAIVLVMAIAGIWICGQTANELGIHDFGGIVWDEIVGMLCALIALPQHWIVIVLAFGLFRLFDIVKPWPICWLDKIVPGGTGIMLDDVLAGLTTCAILHLFVAKDWLPLS